ncbi:unnamed protein product [Adineta steineri]|uniref:Uncharacterized protein n=1 Tax=Adineta steineri TaxID=433720 RepID=A0A814A1T1_9BILA|nr:unnamed protein product [Adineta steineri]CAF1148731.1 unnamed protein product [Adineta steineri]
MYNSNHNPASETTRLNPGKPMAINLTSYTVCHPQELYLDNLVIQYHNKFTSKESQACFLIENLDGGSWWSYVTHEFAEILTHLKQLSIESNITYLPFPEQTKLTLQTNLKKYFLNACDIDTTLPKEKQRPIIILLWDINRLLWHRMRRQWEDLLSTTRTRLIVFVDDLHFTSKLMFTSRQFIFQSVATEILATYPYLFQNYYTDISPSKIIWVPHAASTLTNRTINETAENVLFVSGASMRDWYPCRAHGFDVCRKRKDLASCLKHPGYGPTMMKSDSYYYGGERYFSYMRKYVFGLGTCVSVHYAIAKLFEIPANGLVLVTTDDMVPILKSLHLNQDEHFLTINCSSISSLKNEIIRIQNMSKENLTQIRQKSQEIVYQRHLTKHRAELIHVRLLSQALLATPAPAEGNIQWEQWGRNCR